MVISSTEFRARWEADRERRETAELERYAMLLMDLFPLREPART